MSASDDNTPWDPAPAEDSARNHQSYPVYFLPFRRVFCGGRCLCYGSLSNAPAADNEPHHNGDAHQRRDDGATGLLWDDNGTETWEPCTPYAIANGDDWNDVKIRIRCDGRVEFYAGNDAGTLIYTSTHTVTPAYDGMAAVAVGNRKSYYDNVAVTNRCGPYCRISVPTVSEWGMVAMALLVLSAGTLVFMRRRTAVT